MYDYNVTYRTMTVNNKDIEIFSICKELFTTELIDLLVYFINGNSKSDLADFIEVKRDTFRMKIFRKSIDFNTFENVFSHKTDIDWDQVLTSCYYAHIIRKLLPTVSSRTIIDNLKSFYTMRSDQLLADAIDVNRSTLAGQISTNTVDWPRIIYTFEQYNWMQEIELQVDEKHLPVFKAKVKALDSQITTLDFSYSLDEITHDVDSKKADIEDLVSEFKKVRVSVASVASRYDEPVLEEILNDMTNLIQRLVSIQIA